MPAVPSITQITIALSALATARLSSCSSSRSRPVNPATSRGSCAGTSHGCAGPGSSLDVAGDARCVSACITASTSSAGARPRAAAMNKARAGSARFKASASNNAVSLRAVRLMPRSRSLTDRELMPAAWANSSCVSLASPRSRRSNPANSSAGCCSMILSATPQILAPMRAIPARREGYGPRLSGPASIVSRFAVTGLSAHQVIDAILWVLLWVHMCGHHAGRWPLLD